MTESGNYPLGAQYDKNAPWNQKDNPEMEFNCICSQTLSKDTTVFTDQYSYISEKEWDGEMWVNSPDIDTSNVDWKNEYHANDHYTPLQLIELFQKYLLDEVNGSNTMNRNDKYLNHLISECNNWTEDETEYVV